MANKSSIVADILIQFKLEGRSKEEVKRGLAELEREISRSGMRSKDARELRGLISQVNKELDQTTIKAKQADTALGNIAKGLTGAGLITLGNSLQRLGTGILSPLRAFQAASGGSGEFASQMQRIENSTLRIGASMATAILPALTKAADLAQTVAGIVERHPELATGVIGLGITANVLGKITSAIGTLVLFRAGAGALGIGGGTAVAGGAAGGGGSIAGAAAGGLGAVVLALAAPEVALGLASFLAVLLAVRGLEKLGQGPIDRLRDRYGYLTPAGFESRAEHDARLAALREQTAPETATPFISQSVLNSFIAFQKGLVEAEEKYEEQRSAIVEAAGQQRAQIEASSEQQRSAIIAAYNQQSLNAARQFAAAEAQAEAQYYASRLALARRFSVEVQRAEEDHQRSLRRLRADYMERQVDLEGARDAIGIVLNRRNYERQRDEAEEDYQIASQRRSEDFARQLAEMESQFIAARAARYADYLLQQQERAEQQKIRLAEVEANRKLELANLAKATNDKLRDLATQYQKERVQRINAFNELLRDQGIFLAGQRELWAAYLAAMTADLQAYINAYGGQGVLPGRAMGGPVTAGRAYIVGERRPELFVPRESGTIYPSVGNRVNLTLNLRYFGDVTSTSKREIERMIRSAVPQIMTKALG